MERLLPLLVFVTLAILIAAPSFAAEPQGQKVTPSSGRRTTEVLPKGSRVTCQQYEDRELPGTPIFEEQDTQVPKRGWSYTLPDELPAGSFVSCGIHDSVKFIVIDWPSPSKVGEPAQRISVFVTPEQVRVHREMIINRTSPIQLPPSLQGGSTKPMLNVNRFADTVERVAGTDLANTSGGVKRD